VTGLKHGMVILGNINIIVAIWWCFFILIYSETNTMMVP